MIKAFLSHSSKQKPFIKEVASILGREKVILDEFVFESGRKLIDEINNSLDVTSIFVYFISEESLESEWCKRELSNIRDLIDENKCLFCAFIIDPNITIDDKRIKPWIKNYLTNSYSNANTLSRVLLRQMQELIWEKHPELEVKQHHFVGRENDFKIMMRKIYENMDHQIRSIIVSGIKHIGRKRFLHQFMIERMDNSLHPSYCPFDVSLKDTDSIDSFIKQLNSFIRLYSNSELNNELLDISNHKNIAVKLINEIINAHERIRINDDCCIVNRNGFIADWFIDVVTQADLCPSVSLFVASTCTVNPTEVRRQNKVIKVHQLQPLSRDEMKILFNVYAKALGVKCDDENTNKLLSYCSGYPEQVFDIVDDLANQGLPTTYKDLPEIEKKFDDDVVKLLNHFKNDEKSMQLLIILSKFEYIRFHQLVKVFGEADLESYLEKFGRYAIYECFGTNREFIRMNRVLAEYIDRNKLPLNRTYKKKLAEYTEELLRETDDETLDLAEELYRSKHLLADKRFKVKTETILPSVALKVIVEQYRAFNYHDVIELSKKILYDNNRNDYESIKRSIRYWLCLSYCKLGEDFRTDLDIELQHFEGYTKFFILGYAERNIGNYSQAERFYNMALENVHKSRYSRYTSKAAHELVITKMKQGNFDGALEQAEKNYLREKTNVFHIEAYYRCYVRTYRPDKKILKSLISEMKSSYDANKDVIAKTFEAEYDYFVKKDHLKAIDGLKHVLVYMSGPCRNYAAETLYFICKRTDLLPVYKDIIQKSKLDTDKIDSFVYE